MPEPKVPPLPDPNKKLSPEQQRVVEQIRESARKLHEAVRNA